MLRLMLARAFQKLGAYVEESVLKDSQAEAVTKLLTLTKSYVLLPLLDGGGIGAKLSALSTENSIDRTLWKPHLFSSSETAN